METIGSKRSYALTWCMPNNDDDDDIVVNSEFYNKPSLCMREVLPLCMFSNIWCFWQSLELCKSVHLLSL